MARVAITLTYELVFSPREAEQALSPLLVPTEGLHRHGLSREQPYRISMWELGEASGRVAAALTFQAETEETETWQASSSIRRLSDELLRCASREMHSWRIDAEREGLGDASTLLERVKPGAEIEVPLLDSDSRIVLNDAAARRTVAASVREIFPFLADQQKRLDRLAVRLQRDSLVIASPDAQAAVDAADAYLSARLRQAQPRQFVAAPPIWAWASAAVALTSVGFSFLRLSWMSVAVFAAVVLAVSGAAVKVAPSWSVRRSITALGLMPIVAFSAFACVYGAIALLEPSAFTTHIRDLREPLLLSLSLLTTVGVLDLKLNGWVRSIAYLEMLLVASLAGGAAIVATRTVSRRARALLDELRAQRG